MSADFWFQQQGGGPNPDLIGNSLRFRGAQRLNWTPSSNGNARTWTQSLWIKIGNDINNNSLGTTYITRAKRWVSGTHISLRYVNSNSNNEFNINQGTNSASGSGSSISKYRDPSAWYHVVLKADFNNATATERMVLYVNGEVVPMSATANQQADGSWMIGGTNHVIGAGENNNQFFTGYIAEYHNVDGQALGPEAFGEYNADGVWMPKKVSGLTYGSNGFYLDFSDPNNIGADRSGNGNNFTPNGFELSNIGSRYLPYDWVADSPTNNYSTYNPLDLPTGNIGSANLTHGQSAASYGNARNGFRIPSSGRWALEVQTSGMGSSGTSHWGFAMEGSAYNTATNFNYAATSTGNANPANLSINGTGVGQHTFNSVFRLEVDMDASPPSVQTFRGGTSINTQDWTDYDGTSDVYFYTRAVNGSSFAINYGQQPLTNAASAGFEPLSTAGLPNVAITNPSEHFQVITDTGANILTNAQATFPNGLWWIKDRANSNQHQLVDSVRGGNLRLTTPNETTEAAYSAPSGNSIAFCWNLVNDRSNGFDIVLYDGNSANRTVPHNLGVEPEFLMVCNRNRGAAAHRVWTPFYSAAETLAINSGRSKTTENTIFNNTAPTASVFSLGNSSMNQTGINYVAYLWRSVPGFSRIGRWSANGVRDGAFIYTGFRPAFIMYKPINASANWGIRTTAMSPQNPSNRYVFANSAAAESTALEIDILSNGFKWREDGGQSNNPGQDCLFMAFAEHPFGGANVSPSPAR